MDNIIAYIPSQFADDIVDLAVNLAGGATVTPGSTGYWRDNDGNLVTEPVTLIQVFVDPDRTVRLLSRIRDYLRDGGEQAFAYTMNGVPVIIDLILPKGYHFASAE